MGNRRTLTRSEIRQVFASTDPAQVTAARFGIGRQYVYTIRARMAHYGATVGLTPGRVRRGARARIDHAKTAALIKHTDLSYREIAERVGCSVTNVGAIAKKYGINRAKPEEPAVSNKPVLREDRPNKIFGRLSPFVDWAAVDAHYPRGRTEPPAGPRPVKIMRFVPGYCRKGATPIVQRVYSVSDRPPVTGLCSPPTEKAA